MGQQGETHTLQGRRLDETGLTEPSLRGPARSKCSFYGHVVDFSSTKVTQATLPAGKLHSKLQRVWSMGVGPEYFFRFRFYGLGIQMCLNMWKKGWNSLKWTPLNLGLPSSSWKTDSHFFFFPKSGWATEAPESNECLICTDLTQQADSGQIQETGALCSVTPNSSSKPWAFPTSGNSLALSASSHDTSHEQRDAAERRVLFCPDSIRFL